MKLLLLIALLGALCAIVGGGIYIWKHPLGAKASDDV
jgi:hypothetical protein